MKNEHTQTPWCCESSIGIIRQASTGKAICAMPHALKKNAIRKLRAGEEAEISADQKHIIKCVNSHDELLAALKVTQERLGKLGFAVPEVDAAIARAEAQ